MRIPKRCEYRIQGDNGYDISCLEWPCENAEAVLLCLHGFAGDKYSTVIQALGERLPQDSVRVITFDWPGHGASPVGGEELRIQNCLSDLNLIVRNIRQANPELPLYLFATSFGAFLGLNYTAVHPDVFSGVILRSPALGMPETFLSFLTPEEKRMMEDGRKINKGFERPLWLGKEFYEDLSLHRLTGISFPEGVAGLILQGDLDDVVNPQDSYAFAQQNHFRLHVVRGADHRYKNEGDLEEILSVTASFLKKDE